MLEILIFSKKQIASSFINYFRASYVNSKEDQVRLKVFNTPGLISQQYHPHNRLDRFFSLLNIMSNIKVLETKTNTLSSKKTHLNNTNEKCISFSKITTNIAISSCKTYIPTPHTALSSSASLEKQNSIQKMNSLEEKKKQDTLRILVQNLDIAAINQRLIVINLSRRGLTWLDGRAICTAMGLNPHLVVLKLSYNYLENRGAAIIAGGFVMEDKTKHPSLKVLDLGFNSIGDAGCVALALHALNRNFSLSTLYLSGNYLRHKGAIALAGAILQGCSLSELHLSANPIGEIGVQALAQAIAEQEILVVSGDNRKHDTMQRLHLVGIKMGHKGVVTLSRMLLNNSSVRTLCLSNNGIDDNDLALLAQSLSRNKKVPLEIMQLSFNEITCAGLECFMNAVWGSQTLKEIRVDNNRIKDRGAQLAAVVLTSISLEVIDISFNRVTTVGIKSIMKSLSENASLRYLGLSGIQMDSNAAKALSYGLAYNSTLRYLHIDNCAIGYAAQRHIIAGVVSNRLISLRILTGFSIGAIAATLGLPQELERWTNDQCLSFIRSMWKQWRQDNGLSNNIHDRDAYPDMLIGPAPAQVVKRAAQMAIQIIGINDASSLNTEDHQKDVSDTSPLVCTNDIMLEKSKSGTLKVPANVQTDKKVEIEGWHFREMQSKRQCADMSIYTEKKNRNLKWLRSHFQSLHQVGQLPFSETDLQQLHQYFFAPIVQALDFEESKRNKKSQNNKDKKQSRKVSQNALEDHCNDSDQCQMPLHTRRKSSFDRAISFQRLGDAKNPNSTSLPSQIMSSSCTRRRTLETMEKAAEKDFTFWRETEPASKRAKNFKPRIAYYPRIRQLLEDMRNRQSQSQMLPLLRQLKFVESIMLEGKNIYESSEVMKQANHSTLADVEMIILDLL